MRGLSKQGFREDTAGDAIVEATILLPIMMMIYAGLVLLSIYLPTRALLQRATQYAATAIATQRSDTWLYYDEDVMQYRWIGSKEELDNVYLALFKAIGSGEDGGEAETIVSKVEGQGFQCLPGELRVVYRVTNFVIYKEVHITATRTIPSPVDLSFVGFPKEIPITVSSTAVVQNGDEFVRNMDIAVDVAEWLDEKYEIFAVFDKAKELLEKVNGFLGI